MLFDLLGINILTGAEDNNLFLAAGDEQISVVVEISQVAGAEPAILKYCSRGLGPLVVAFHDDAAANGDLADLWR